MPTITVYSGPNCPYCVRAKELLKKKGANFDVIDVKADREQFDVMLSKSGGRRTIPQIFIGELHVGGCDDLHALDAAGKLDALLAG
ncbi:MAG: glutaredoxin 3 [Alphaproteobacteria bacterium]|nr:glutaredoxin 3 [Alphaproteobacteria bacterium]